MRLFRKKKQEPREVVLVSARSILHRFLLDSQMQEAQQLGTLLGLPPLEDADVEEEASAERIAAAAPLLPIIYYFTTSISASVSEYFRTMGKDEMTEDQSALLTSLMSRVTMSAVLGSVCQLEDMGLIEYTYGGSK